MICFNAFTHSERCKYTCYECNTESCLKCIYENCCEGTGTIHCPDCNLEWNENEYTLHFAAFQIRLLREKSLMIRENMKSAEELGKKRKRDIYDDSDNQLSIKRRKITDDASTIEKEKEEGEIYYPESDADADADAEPDADADADSQANFNKTLQNILQRAYSFPQPSFQEPRIFFRTIPIGKITTITQPNNASPNSTNHTITEELSQNDSQYFNKLTEEDKEQLELYYKEVINESSTNTKTPVIFQILRNTRLSLKVKSIALNMLKNMKGGCSGETLAKNTEWLRGLLKIPFGIQKPLPVLLSRDGAMACGEFLEKSRKQLDECIYGMDAVKMQILQMIGLWLTNPDAACQPIGLCGPAGVGKTSILRNGIAPILGRAFAMVPLGGVSDARLLKGFEMTYVGSQCGRIVEILQEMKQMNPVILFDEVDKIGTKNGADEVTAALIHLTDRTSNTDFQDTYYRGISLNISGALMTFSMNDINSVNPILRNRMKIINVPAYNKSEKVEILRRHIIPRVEKEFNINHTISNEVLRWFVEKYDGDEGGVRELIRSTETLYSRLNLARMNVGGFTIQENNTILNKDSIEKIMSLYNDKKEIDESWRHLYI